MAHDVFISYSIHDKAIADAVCAALENKKVRCWIAPRDVLAGVPYAEAIIDAINQGSILVLVFSENSNRSPQVMREIERAVHKGIPILPFRIEEVVPSKAMEYYLSAPHWLDALTPPLERHLEKLADTVQILLLEYDRAPGMDSSTSVTQTFPKARWWQNIGRKHLVTGLVFIALLLAIPFIFSDAFMDYPKPPADLPAQPEPDEMAEPVPTPTQDTASTVSEKNGSLISGDSLRSELAFLGEVHWYTFDAEAGETVQIILTEGVKNSEMWPWLGLFNPDGEELFERRSPSTVSTEQKLHETGTYTIRVRDHANVGGLYSLSFN